MNDRNYTVSKKNFMESVPVARQRCMSAVVVRILNQFYQELVV